jgi:hypothetical protein
MLRWAIDLGTLRCKISAWTRLRGSVFRNLVGTVLQHAVHAMTLEITSRHWTLLALLCKGRRVVCITRERDVVGHAVEERMSCTSSRHQSQQGPQPMKPEVHILAIVQTS